MPPSSSTPALQPALLASATVEETLGLRFAVAVEPHYTFDPLGSGGGEILRQDSRPASASGGLSGSNFEDPEAVLESRHLSDIGPAPPSRIRRQRDRRVHRDRRDHRDHRDRHDCRDLARAATCHVGFFLSFPSNRDRTTEYTFPLRRISVRDAFLHQSVRMTISISIRS